MSDEIPRRCRMEHWTPAERAIYEALLAVETMAADVRLTDAVILLQAARDSVADFVDGMSQELPKRGVPELIKALRARADALTGQPWERTASAAMMKEAADALESAPAVSPSTIAANRRQA